MELAMAADMTSEEKLLKLIRKKDAPKGNDTPHEQAKHKNYYGKRYNTKPHAEFNIATYTVYYVVGSRITKKEAAEDTNGKRPVH